MSLLKCVVGAGSFILPSAVKDAGLVLGFVSLLILGLASAYTINQLALAGRIVAKANPNRRVPTYVDVGRAIIGEWTKPITYFGVVATLIGVCAVYLDFIGQMLSDVIDNKLTVKEVQAVLIAPLILLSWLRNFKWLAWTSIVGDIAVVCGVIVVLAYGWYHHGIVSPTKLPAANLSSYSQFFGQSVFLFAVHTVILPLSQAMREPRRFSWVVNVSFFWIVIINALFGAFGYMIFRDETKGMVLDNVQGKVVSKFVKVLLAVDLFFTVPIVLSAPRRLIERSFIAEVHTPVSCCRCHCCPRPVYSVTVACAPQGDPYTTLKENLIRSGCVAVFAGLAFLVPNINDLATLVGGMVSPLMGFILPPIFYLRLFKGKLSQLTVMLNWILIVFGTFAGIFTTIQQIRSMA